MQAVIDTDELSSLLMRCAGGDRAAFERLYRLQSARLYGLALRITRNQGAAADAVQEGLLQAWRNAARFDPARGGADSWLMGLVRYRALDIIRRTGREVGAEALPEPVDESPDALARMMQASEGEALRRCLEELAPERRSLIVAAFVEGLSHSELATRLSEPLGTIKSWIRRSLQSLRKCLAPS